MSATALTSQTFRALLNEPFSVRADDGSMAQLVLRDCSEPVRAGGFESFAVTFEGGPDGPAVQGTFLLSAEHLPQSPVFLVPVGQLAKGLEYQAVFNQRIEEES